VKPADDEPQQTSWITEGQVSGQLDLLEGHPNDRASLDRARAEAQKNANEHQINMAVGWQNNDVTGLDEYGYCPWSAIGPAFVHTIIEMIEPYKDTKP